METIQKKNNIKDDQIIVKILWSYQDMNWIALQLTKTQNQIYEQIP